MMAFIVSDYKTFVSDVGLYVDVYLGVGFSDDPVTLDTKLNKYKREKV